MFFVVKDLSDLHLIVQEVGDGSRVEFDISSGEVVQRTQEREKIRTGFKNRYQH